MTLSKEKTVFMNVSNNKKQPYKNEITLGITHIKPAHWVRLLGVIINKNLTFEPHVDYVFV